MKVSGPLGLASFKSNSSLSPSLTSNKCKAFTQELYAKYIYGTLAFVRKQNCTSILRPNILHTKQLYWKEDFNCNTPQKNLQQIKSVAGFPSNYYSKFRIYYYNDDFRDVAYFDAQNSITNISKVIGYKTICNNSNLQTYQIAIIMFYNVAEFVAGFVAGGLQGDRLCTKILCARQNSN